MQEIKKPSIVIASILKPVDDTRMFEKLAHTLNNSGKWNIHIIGYGKVVSLKDIQVHPLGTFNRISFTRILSPIRVLLLLFRIKPKVLVINTHELLIVASVFKLFVNCKVVYDVMENYFLNIVHTNAFPSPSKYLIAHWVRLKEWITRPMIHHYLLAERSYQQELPFIGEKFTVIENKCVVPSNFKKKNNPNVIRLLFTGTIDKSTGIWQTIDLCKSLHALDSRVELHIAGYCAKERLRNEILKEIKKHPFISYDGFDRLIGHTKILEEISIATAGIVFYPPSIHNKDRIPTKVYEYLAYQLPILFDSNVAWKDLVMKSKGGIEINFAKPDCQSILVQLVNNNFYPQPAQDVHWSSEEGKLLSAID